jgi:flagellar hook-length control protein FliK
VSSFQKTKPAAKNSTGLNAGDDFLAISPLAGRNPQLPTDIRPLPVQITGHVTQGAMTRERLSSEALSSIGTGIRNLGSQGGGEIRIRLKPENLGELHLKVVTRGNEVGLRIQASDDQSKRIIEESMGYLKDSLSANQLTVARVEVTVAQAGASSFLSDSNSQNSGSNAQQNFNSAWESQQQSSFNGSQQQGASSERNNSWEENSGDRRLSGSTQARRSSSVIPAQVAGSAGGAARWTTTSAAGGSRLNLFA